MMMSAPTKQALRDLMAQAKAGSSMGPPDEFLDCYNAAKARAATTPGLDVHAETMRLWKAKLAEAQRPEPTTPFQKRIEKLRVAKAKRDARAAAL